MAKIIHYQKNPLCPEIYKSGVLCKCGILSFDATHKLSLVTCKKCINKLKQKQ